jgi:hypothetical protein
MNNIKYSARYKQLSDFKHKTSMGCYQQGNVNNTSGRNNQKKNTKMINATTSGQNKKEMTMYLLNANKQQSNKP